MRKLQILSSHVRGRRLGGNWLVFSCLLLNPTAELYRYIPHHRMLCLSSCFCLPVIWKLSYYFNYSNHGLCLCLFSVMKLFFFCKLTYIKKKNKQYTDSKSSSSVIISLIFCTIMSRKSKFTGRNVHISAHYM